MTFWSVFGPAFLWLLIPVSLLWLLSVRLKNASIVDVFWGLGFVFLTWFYYLATPDGLPARKLLTAVLVTIWGLRLSLYLLWRNWGKPEDFRYQAFRQKYGPERYWWLSFFQVFLLQGVLMWLISAPLLAAQRASGTDLTFLDGLALVVWVVGFLFEAGGDWQLAQFKRNPANKGQLLTTGFWRYTRHPNYFGDACVWWGYALFCLAAGSLIPIVGSLLMTFLLVRVSGVALLERTLVASKPGYEAYQKNTSAFLPWPKRE